ncbi:MAG: serine hydrolase [Turicibacter sp.]|nr:serine hydrolase [Turicibacter sp.]
MPDLFAYPLELIMAAMAVVVLLVAIYFHRQRLVPAARLFAVIFVGLVLFLGVRVAIIADIQVPEENRLAQYLPEIFVRPTPIPISFEGELQLKTDGLLEIQGAELVANDKTQWVERILVPGSDAIERPMEPTSLDEALVEATQKRDVIYANSVIKTVDLALSIDPSELNSEIALLVELYDGQAVTHFAKNADVQMYPASMTKVMTALVALENLGSLDEQVMIDPAIIDELFIQGASTAGFAPGMPISARDALYGIMIPSGADASYSLAQHISGDVTSFVALMNAKAAELGMDNTHFVNPIGLHDDQHFTTAEDLMLLLEYALTQPEFVEIFTEMGPLELAGVPMISTLFGMMTPAERESGLILGGRTGFTPEAGRCLMSYTIIEGRTFLLVTGRAFDDAQSQRRHIEDALDVFGQIRDEISGGGE